MKKIEDMENRNNHKNQETVKTDKTVKTAGAFFSESLKSLMQIFIESAKSAKSIFATSATSATANFVGKASCERTMRYGVRSRIPSFLFRYSLDPNLSRFSLASLICLCMLTVGVGNVWGTTSTLTLSSSNKFGTSSGSTKKSSDNVITWTATTTAGAIQNTYSGSDQYNGQQFGTGTTAWTGTFTTSSVASYKITSVAIVANTGGSATLNVSVGGDTYTTANQSVTKKSGGATPLTYTFSGTSTGNITITVSNTDKAFYLQSIAVTYTTNDCNTLSAPGSPSSTAHATSVDLSWNSVANSSGYLVTFDGTEYNIASGTTTKTITGLKKEKTYTWTVAAKGDGSTYCAVGTATSEQSVTTLDGCSDSKVTYTVASTSSVTPSGAPAGTSATFSNTYTSNKYQITKDNSQTLTLNGYAGKKIKGLTLDMRSNGSAGAGTFSMVIGSTTVASIASATNFNEWYDNDSYGTDYRKVHVTLSDEVTVGTGENIVITIAATTNSLFCQGFALCYSSCTPLGSINGSVSWSNGSKATLVWDKDANATGYVVKWKTHAGAEGTYATTNVSSINDTLTTKKTCAISSLTAGTEYDFKIFITGKTSPTVYCDKDSVMTAKAPKITVKSAPVALTGSDYAEGATGGGTVKTFIVSGVGLTGALTFTAPTNFQVSTDNGSTWSTDGGTKTLAASGTLAETTIKARLVEGLLEGSYGGATTYVTISGGGAAAVNSSVSITGTVSSACTAPTVATPTLTSIASGTITPSCASVTVDDNCDVTDYGFVWKASSDPTIDDNKTSLGDETPASAFSSDLSISFTTGNTYKIKAYAINSAGTTLSSPLTVTPQSVTFNSNGGSDVATAYVNNGGTVSQPSNPTKTHYTFGGWYTDNGTWASAVNFSSTITEDKTYYAKWNPVSYTITTSGLTNVAPTSDFPTSFTYTGSTTTNLNRTLAVDGDNFFLPDALTVTMGGATLTAGTDYTYSNSTGAFTFDVTITGNVVISGSAVAKLKSIAITTEPTKTVYFAGEAFSNTGAVVTATMGDETTKAVSGSAVWTPSGALTAEASKTMTATYTERGISKTATTTVDVYSVTVNKVNEDGDAISADGVTATWTVGTKALAASVGSTNYVFKEWAFVGSNNGLSISSTTSANTTITGTPTGNVTIKAVFYKPVAVTWTVNGESYDEGSPTDYVKRGTQWKSLTLPTAPDDDALESGCDVDKFMGWTNMTEHWVGVTHDDAPTVCLKSFSGVTTVINDPIEFKAVYAKESLGSKTEYTSTFTMKQSSGPGSPWTDSSHGNAQWTYSGLTFANTENSGMPNSSWLAVELPSGAVAKSYSVVGTNNAWSTSNITITVTGAGLASDITTFNDKGATYDFIAANKNAGTYTFSCATASSKVAYINYIEFVFDYTPATYSDYITLCSSTNITISDPSITGEGEITFDQESPVPTCLAAQTITATVTPDAGYECTALSFTGGSVSVSPTISDVLPLTEETEFELSFAKDANGTLATSATFSPKAVTNWTWTYGGEAIPNPVNLYVGEKARFDVTYEPSDVIAEKKTYTRTKVDAYINWVGDVYANYFYCSGKASTGESTTTVTVTHADGPTQNIYIKVKPLPTVTFVDNVHNLTDFTNWGTDGVVSSTVTTGVVSHTKVTPSHDNIDEPGTGNTCEKQHLHLVGWIRSDYDKVADYMDGTTSDKPTESEILSAGTDGEGLEYFFAPNASINIETYNGLTFYAVWALVE